MNPEMGLLKSWKWHLGLQSWPPFYLKLASSLLQKEFQRGLVDGEMNEEEEEEEEEEAAAC